MTAMRDDLAEAIANSVRVVVEDLGDGTQITRGLDDETTLKITEVVIQWFTDLPKEGFAAEHYEAGHYSRSNIAAMIEDINDDA